MNRFDSFSRVVPWCMALLLGTVVAGCGGGGQEPILGGGVATLAPSVTAVTPLAGATLVPVSTRTLTASFSKAMDPSSLTAASFTLSCPGSSAITGGTVSYNAVGNMATLSLPALGVLPASSLCTAKISTAARDSSGTALQADFSWNFTTGLNPDTTAPTVSATINANGAMGVATNTKVGVTFSEVMDPTSITATSFTLMQGATAVAGTVSYSGTSAVFAPSSPLATNTRYTGIIRGGANGVRDLAGNTMVSDYVWSWTTGAAPDTTAPTVTGTIHANSATNVFTNAKVGATFSEAMNPASITSENFSLREAVSGNVVAGTVTYSGVNAVFVPQANLATNTSYTVRVKGGALGVADLAGNVMVNDFVISWTTGALADALAPTVIQVNPADLATNVVATTSVNATFSEAMDPLSVNTASFTVAGVSGLVSYNATSRMATFTPSSLLAANTLYTATVSTGAKDQAGNALATNKVWRFTTAAVTPPPVAIELGSAGAFGSFGGSAGMTNMGTLTQVNASMGTIATNTSSITGFHDTLGDIYTQTPSNTGFVNGTLYTCTNSTTGPTATGPNPAACAVATQARLDAQAAYLALAALPPGANPGANLAGLTLAPGVYTSPSGSFLIEGADLTLDAQGDANAVFVFQMATTLTVGGPGAAAPRSIILAGGAQARNVYWQVGSFATINAAGGGTMVGTIISQAGASFSTAGNVNIVTLNGRVLSLGASVTLVNTVINTP